MSTFTQIEKIVNDTVHKYISLICKKYTLDSEDLNNLWYDTNYSNNCQYVLIKGARTGQKCGLKTKNNETFCIRHSKEKEQKVKKIIPEVKKVETTTFQSSKILRKHKTLNVLWHPATQLVFKSAKERVVIGIVRDDVIDKLTDDDILVCKKMNFQFDENIEDEQDIENVLKKITK